MTADVAVDGFVAYSLPRDAAALRRLLARNAPLVVVDQPRLPGVATESIDDQGGAREAARHLVRLGHRRFGIVALSFQPDGYSGPAPATRASPASFDVTAQRLEGYRAGIAEAGHDADVVPIFECAHSDENLGRQAGRYLLESAVPPTAVLAMSDRLALGVLAAAGERRVHVPGSLSVVGFDNIGGAAHSRPALTTVRQPPRLKGYAAARLLLDAPDRRPTSRAGAAAGDGPDERRGPFSPLTHRGDRSRGRYPRISRAVRRLQNWRGLSEMPYAIAHLTS